MSPTHQLATHILDMARDGKDVSREVITWALRITGDLNG